MKTLILFILITFCINSKVISQISNNKINGLEFSKAFFISMKSDNLRDYVAIDTTIIIEKGKVWNITSSKSFMVKDDYTPYENEINLWINGQIIDFYKSPFSCPIWLPEGKYRIRLMSYLKSKNLHFISYISGIEYLIINKDK